MKTIAISKFKANALRLLDHVSKSQEDIIVTKHGKPIARIVPYRNIQGVVKPGSLSHCLLYENDIIAPFGPELWESGS